MLRRVPFGRPRPGPKLQPSGPLAEAAGALVDPAAGEAAPTARAFRWRVQARLPRLTRRRLLFAVLAVSLLGAVLAYGERQRFSAEGADLSRRLIGDENTARLESWYFRLQDRADRLKFRVLGGGGLPLSNEQVVVQVLPLAPGPVVYIDRSKRADLSQLPEVVVRSLPPPLAPPEIKPLRASPDPGEGAWTAAGLPRNTATDPLMLKTFLRPDPARPYASVGVLLVDSRRVRLHITGGTIDPGGDRGVKGPGTIPQGDVATLLAAWNGGFKGPHGGFGMRADGKEYRPLRNGLATVCVDAQGAITMGEWGAGMAWAETLVACRQNAVLLVKDGEVSKRVGEGNDTWGYVNVNSAEFITWRSAIGLTKDGNLLVAAGNSLSAATLAKALQAAGAYTAMQLDINSPYVLTALFFGQSDGSLRAEKFMDSMPDSASRFFKTQERDFMYLTYDDSRYRSLVR